MKTKQYPASMTEEENKRLEKQAVKHGRSPSNYRYWAIMEQVKRDESGSKHPQSD